MRLFERMVIEVWVLRACQYKGVVNELCCSSDEIASKMMETFERAGYRWVDTVTGETEYAYTLERR